MKIAIVIPQHNFNRSTRAAIPQLAYTYAQRSAFRETIQFFCGWDADPLDPKASILPQTIDMLDVEKAGPLFADRIRHFQPDVVEIHQNFRIAFYLADVLPHLPVVLYSHQPNNNLISIKNHDFAHVVCVSHTSAQEAAKHLPTTKFTVIHNALATEGWIAKESEKENIILFCGRIVSHKGIQQFIEAAAAIKSQFTDWRFVVLGRVGQNENERDFFDQQKEKFQNLLGDQGLWIENALLEQVQTWIKKAKISVAPSDWEEVFPLSLLEMHLASCGVISSGRGGMKEVSSLDGALYLKEMSAAAIAESMRFLIENEPERKALARRGHEYVMRHHRIDDRVAELDALRHQIIQRFKQKKGIWRRHVLYEQLRALKAKLFG